VRERAISLWFAGQTDVQLIQTSFLDCTEAGARVTVRGKDNGAFRGAGTFQWTSAVRGLCILLVRAKLASLTGMIPPKGHLSGERGSLAASLDYAMTKQPGWLVDMFGTDSLGASPILRLISRTNSNRKRPGPVVLSLNERALDPSRISIDWNGQRIETISSLTSLLALLWQSNGANEGALLAYSCTEKLAA